LATIPKYISIIFGGAHALVALRALRLLRVFRILKLARYLVASRILIIALRASRIKIAVFLFTVLVLTIILGTIMYLVEGPENGFTSIPHSMYWAIVTLTTVGYGDLAPHTPFGQFIASIVMILGYGIIAVPTGIVTSEITRSDNIPITNTQHCSNCSASRHVDNAEYCHKCGRKLNHE
jgi:voltage-gated potassium channel